MGGSSAVKMYNYIKKIILKHKKLVIISIVLLTFYAFLLPKQLFKQPTSIILEDANGNLLAASIATDGQWRFPENSVVPEKFKQCIIHFEDEYFEYHPGVNPVSVLRALWQNITSGKVKSGGSTITMQVIRLSRKQPRTILEKSYEMILATRLEISKSKKEILALYTSHAPFGGNVVGLDAAAWRYYGRSPDKLSWGETATLAVLPNAPALIYPGKNHELLLKKRNRLLDKLQLKGIIDAETAELAKAEELPTKPHSLPQITPHLLTRLIKEGHQGENIQTTVNLHLQEQLNQIASNYHRLLSQNEVHNLAILVTEVNSGKVLAYVGNSDCKHEESGVKVDIITAPRSSGSILKPFLYGALFNEGELLADALVPDVPTRISGYAPQNFDRTYDGAVPASNALTRSLNIPAVKLLRSYGLEKFYDNVQKLGFTTIKKPVNHYGLSIILGGAETNLWELNGVYSSWSRVLNNFRKYDYQYNTNDYRMPYFIANDSVLSQKEELKQYYLYDVSSIWQTYEILANVHRPREEKGWEHFTSSKKVAWKTGTSFGHRDAWAVGTTPEYTVSVWVGNADGEGRPGLTGTLVAAPILFEVFKKLPQTTWFEPPYNNLSQLAVCSKSGYLYGNNCEKADTIWAPNSGIKSKVCPYHKLVYLDKSKQFRVNDECYSVTDMQIKKWMVLPPIMELFYKTKNPNYKSLPLLLNNCYENTTVKMGIIYPENLTAVFIPKLLDGIRGKVIFEVAHANPNVTIFWHIDDVFIAQTTGEHKIDIQLASGEHLLTLVDEYGSELIRKFNVLEKK